MRHAPTLAVAFLALLVALPLAAPTSITSTACQIGLPCANTGTVLQILTGAGLAGGPITANGTIAVAPHGITGALIANGTIQPIHLGFSIATTSDLANETAARIAGDAALTVSVAAEAAARAAAD